MVCADVSLEDLLAFHVPIDEMAFEAGATIYNMADRASAVYCVRQGVIKLLRYDVSGNQRIVRFLKKGGDVLGLDSVFADEQQHTAIALTATQLCRIPMSHFKDFINKHPPCSSACLKKPRKPCAKRTPAIGTGQQYRPGQIRLARLLLQLRIGDSDRVHRLSLADFGGILGITPETVSRLLTELGDAEILVKAGSGPNGRNYRADIPALTAISLDAGAPARHRRPTDRRYAWFQEAERALRSKRSRSLP